MGSPFIKGQRHKSWLSDTVIFATVFVVVLTITALTDYLNGPADPPAYLIALLGAAGSALFGAVSMDKTRRERDVRDTAERAESKADDAILRSDASNEVALARILDIQERELEANRRALQLMRDAIDAKESAGLEVVKATYTSADNMEHQINELEADIHKRRLELAEQLQSRATFKTRVEQKVDQLTEFAAREHPHDAHMLKPEAPQPDTADGGQK